MEGIRCRQSGLLLTRDSATGHFLHLGLSVFLCTEGCFHFSIFATCAQQGVVMDVMGSDYLRRCSDGSHDVSQRGWGAIM